jgi:hypothetical protein
MWTFAYLRGVGWYLEYGPQHVPDLEKDKFNSFKATNGELSEAQALATLDDKAREKLIVHDKLKAKKV